MTHAGTSLIPRLTPRMVDVGVLVKHCTVEDGQSEVHFTASRGLVCIDIQRVFIFIRGFALTSQ